MIEIKAAKAKGIISAPPSKSMSHRCLIAAALAEGESVIRGLAYSQDVLATLDCLDALGICYEKDNDSVRVFGGKMKPQKSLLCRESGSTLRFFLPLCLLCGDEARLEGSTRLLERPHTVYEDLCREKGFVFRRENGAICVAGNLTAGEYELAADISSQFISGMMFALVRMPEASRIILKGKIESRSYIDLTISALNSFGFPVCWEAENVLYIPGGCKGEAKEITVEGDYSNAAFFEALTLLGGEVEVDGLAEDSLQGDRIYREYFPQLLQEGAELSLADCPDLGPILMAAAAALHGAKFTDTARLKIKESDRGAVMAEELAKFGVKTDVMENSITVHSGGLKKPEIALYGHTDHRIVMSMAVLCTLTGGCIEGAEAVTKSLPDFFERLQALGIEVKEK